MRRAAACRPISSTTTKETPKVIPLRSLNRNVRRLGGALCLAIFALCLTAAPALAAPAWSISLTNDPTELPRTDERMEYVATVTNAGDEPTSAPATVTVELPGGAETAVYEASGTRWTCTKQPPSGPAHAGATCTASGTLEPGDAYRALTVVARITESSEDPGIARATVSGGNAGSAGDEAEYKFEPGPGFPFGILELSPGVSSFEAGAFDESGDANTTAGGHPFEAFTTFGFNTQLRASNERFPTGSIKDTIVDAPRGFVGNALATPALCPSVEEVVLSTCPADSAVGGIDIYTYAASVLPAPIYPDNFQGFADVPIFSLEPEFGEPAQFAFGIILGSVPYTFVPELRADEGYAISFRTAPIITAPALQGVNVNLCDFGAKVQPGSLLSPSKFLGCRQPTEAGAYPHPLITNPTRCAGAPPIAGLRVDSWQHPEEVKTAEYTLSPLTECEKVEFEPESELQPTNHEADSPTGLNVEIKMPLEGVLSPTGVSQANLDTATVTFPKGMSINPATADGLQACSEAQIKLHSNAPDECPESSKVGTIEIDTPLIRETLTGNVYVAQQNHNPFNSTIGLYMSFASARDGVRIKVAGKLVTDPVTGQLTSVFTENPEDPFSRLALKFNSGPRAPLINPPRCGTYAIHSEFSPWSAVNPANPTPQEIVSRDSTYQVTSGPNGSPCPSGGLNVGLNAGLQNPTAGATSTFDLTLTRADGSQRLTALDVGTPPGLSAYLKGIPYCPDATLAGISEAEETGRGELERPSCPAASQVGTVLAGAGSGPFPFQAPGKVYLAGPYKGAPLSLAVVTPAVAGPFDLGNVVIRNALHIDPETAQVTTVSDPIPTILHGILLDIRRIRLSLDRPHFTVAPTNCEPMAVTAGVRGEGGGTADLSDRFQVGNCGALGFKPRLKLSVLGKTNRNAKPRFKAVLTAKPGEANIARAQVNLPHSEFVEQNHIKTVCTRVQWAEGDGNGSACPKGSIYGRAKAWTPLLGHPLEGYVYLRSNGGERKLPDLVAGLNGQASIALWGKVDSGPNDGIRNTFEVVPDAPVSRFVLEMNGGKKGLLVNSENLCSRQAKTRAIVRFTGQNGKVEHFKPKVLNQCGRHRKHKKKHAGHRGPQAGHAHPNGR